MCSNFSKCRLIITSQMPNPSLRTFTRLPELQIFSPGRDNHKPRSRPTPPATVAIIEAVENPERRRSADTLQQVFHAIYGRFQ